MPHRRIASTIPKASTKSLHVLCAEDDKNLAVLLKYALESAGHRVECLGDVRAAFARIAEDLNLFDLVLTDHQMPDGSGLDLVKKLREVGFPGKIIVHSSQLSEEHADAYQVFAVDSILTKPVSMAELIEAVRGIGGFSP